MKRILVTIIYLIVLLSYSFNSQVTYINTSNIFEIVYVIDKKSFRKFKKIRKYRGKVYSCILSIKENLLERSKKYISFLSYDRINMMVSIE